MVGNFQRGQTHLAGYFLCLLIVYCFFQGDMGPAGSVGPIGPQVYILLGLCMLRFVNLLEMFRHCVWFLLFFEQGPPGLDGQMGPPGLRGPQVSRVQGKTVNGGFGLLECSLIYLAASKGQKVKVNLYIFTGTSRTDGCSWT